MKRILLVLSAAYLIVLFINVKISLVHDVHQSDEKLPFTQRKNAPKAEQANPDALNNQHIRSSQTDENENDRLHPQDIISGRDTETLRPKNQDADKSGSYSVAGLHCTDGPEDPSEMVYWRDIPGDKEYVSPLATEEEKYVTFEPDEGGFNNIRMALETVIMLAIAMGRTLVIPPSQGMYLLDDASNSAQKNRFSITDFYPLEAVARENKALKLMSTDDFLRNKELLINRTTQEPLPPLSRTDWNGASKTEIRELHHNWLRWIGVTPPWSTSSCVVPFASVPNRFPTLVNRVSQMMSRKNRLRMKLLNHDAAPVNGKGKVRLAEFVAHRTQVCAYDSDYHAQKVIHFTGDIASGTRLLIHFYAFLYFDKWETDLWVKRFARDRLRYVDEIQCAAARIVKELRKLSPTNEFDTFHIRRGDFKVNKAWLGADEIYSNIEDVMTTNSTIYIATDEMNRSFFEPFYRHHQVYFLSDFDHLIQGLNTNYFGLVEQLVVARGRTFVGCMFSTFTGFVNRLRGYYSTRDKLPGYETGALPNTYHYAPLRTKNSMHTYQFFTKPLNAREFPIAWKDIDFNLENNVSATTMSEEE